MLDVFKRYDVRGVYPSELNSRISEKLAMCLGKLLNNRGRVVLGRDSRISSPFLYNSFVDGLIKSGCDVLEIESATTGLVAFATKFLNADAGVQITASHLPKEWNGFKFLNPDGTGFVNSRLAKLKKIFLEKEYKKSIEKGKKEFCRIEAYEEYFSTIFDLYRRTFGTKPCEVRCVFDAGNGVGALSTPVILNELGCDLLGINLDLDGSFPSREPDVSKDCLKELIQISRDIKADIAIAVDGDADRISVVDDKGNFVDGNKLFCLFAREYTNFKKIVASVDTSRMLGESLKGKVEVITTKVGDIFVEDEMKKSNAVFGGEPNGHWIDSRLVTYPDAVYFSGLVVGLLHKYKKSLSDLLSKLPNYEVVHRKVYCPNGKKEYVINSLRQKFKDKNPVTIDGLKFRTRGSSILIRSSGTEEAIRLEIESKRKKEALRLAGLFENEIRVLI